MQKHSQSVIELNLQFSDRPIENLFFNYQQILKMSNFYLVFTVSVGYAKAEKHSWHASVRKEEGQI